jgi:hypothetical protein
MTCCEVSHEFVMLRPKELPDVKCANLLIPLNMSCYQIDQSYDLTFNQFLVMLFLHEVIRYFLLNELLKKDSPVHVTPASVGSNHFTQ